MDDAVDIDVICLALSAVNDEETGYVIMCNCWRLVMVTALEWYCFLCKQVKSCIDLQFDSTKPTYIIATSTNGILVSPVEHQSNPQKNHSIMHHPSIDNIINY